MASRSPAVVSRSLAVLFEIENPGNSISTDSKSYFSDGERQTEQQNNQETDVESTLHPPDK